MRNLESLGWMAGDEIDDRSTTNRTPQERPGLERREAEDELQQLGQQASYLKTLSEEAHRPDAYDTELSKAEASERVDALQQETGRGL